MEHFSAVTWKSIHFHSCYCLKKKTCLFFPFYPHSQQVRVMAAIINPPLWYFPRDSYTITKVIVWKQKKFLFLLLPLIPNRVRVILLPNQFSHVILYHLMWYYIIEIHTVKLCKIIFFSVLHKMLNIKCMHTLITTVVKPISYMQYTLIYTWKKWVQ